MTGERGPSWLLPSRSFALLAVLAVTSSFCFQCYRVTAGSGTPTASAASSANLGPGLPKILLFFWNCVFLCCLCLAAASACGGVEQGGILAQFLECVGILSIHHCFVFKRGYLFLRMQCCACRFERAVSRAVLEVRFHLVHVLPHRQRPKGEKEGKRRNFDWLVAA